MTMRKVGATKRFPKPSGGDSGGIRIVFRQIVELELDPRNPRQQRGRPPRTRG